MPFVLLVALQIKTNTQMFTEGALNYFQNYFKKLFGGVLLGALLIPPILAGPAGRPGRP